MISIPNNFVLWLIWLTSTLLPLLEAQMLRKRMPSVKPKTYQRIIPIAMMFSAVTGIFGGWLLIDQSNQPQRDIAWECIPLLVPFHIGVLVQVFFHQQIQLWNRSHVLDRGDSDDSAEDAEKPQ